jgi:succinyl-CoA synthetase beta subunit
VALERNFNGPVIITSTQGGSNIEEIAEENPDAIIRHPINITTGLRHEDALSIGERLGFRNGALEEVCLSLFATSFVKTKVYFRIRLQMQ